MANQKEKQQAAEQAAMAVSINPEEMTEGGGLLDNVRVTITDASWEMTDYGGRSTMKRPAAHLVLEEPDGTVHDDQWWSCGKAEDWVPSDDGQYLLPTGLKKQINLSSNFGMFMQSLSDNGFPSDRFEPEIGCLIGLEFHLQQVKAEGREKTKSKDGSKEYDQTVPCAAEIFTFPWEEKKAKSGTAAGKKTGGTAKKKPAAKKAAAKKEPQEQGDTGGGNDEMEETATTIILSLLAESEDGTVPKKALSVGVMKWAKENGLKPADANPIVKMLFNGDEFLGRDGNPWSYEDGIISMG
jgi:hypothetical protein